MQKILNYFVVSLAAVTILATGIVPQFAHAESTPDDPARNAEYQIMGQYVLDAPKIPNKKVKGTPADITSINSAITANVTANTYQQAKASMSSKSVEMFNRTPLFVSDLDAESAGHTSTVVKISKPKFSKGLEYAKVKVKVKDELNKKSSSSYIMIKENGVWKVDYVQMLKKEVRKYLRSL